MQLSGLLDKLKGLFTPGFLISSVTPMFCFLLLNAAILGQFSGGVSNWVHDYFIKGNAEKTVVGAIVSVGVMVAAYVFSTFTLSLREILEGRHLPGWLEVRLQEGERTRLGELESRIHISRQLRRRVNDKVAIWKGELRNERKKNTGSTKPCCYQANDPAAQKIEALRAKQSRGETIDAGELGVAVDALKSVLAKNPVKPAASDEARRLDLDHQRLAQAIDYARARAEDDYIQLFNEKEFNFSRYKVLPTRMGNIAESVRSYSLSRYALNLEFFWTRFQKVLQVQSTFLQTLQDAKTQLDCAVAFFWLTLATTALWMAVLPFLASSWELLICIVVLGPLLTRAWYFVAVQNYRSFADLLRSSVDLFRFDVLSDLKIDRPLNSEAECQLWNQLNRRMGYGDDVVISYNKPVGL